MQLTRRTIFILIPVILFAILLGVTTILAKTGTINIRMLADTVTGNTNQNVTLTVTDSNNQPIPGALTSSKNKTTNATNSGVTDATGKWQVSLANGTYDFTAGGSPECQGTLTNKTVSSTSKSFTIKVTCTAVTDKTKAIIKGKVLEEGTVKAIATATVTTDIGSYSVVTASDGSYQLQVAPGNYNLSASKGGYHMSAAPLYEGNLLAGKSYDAANILMTKDATSGGNGGSTTNTGDTTIVDTSKTSFDVFGNIVLNDQETVAVKIDLELSCSYTPTTGQNLTSPILTTTSTDTFQTVNALKYNFRFADVPKTYQKANLNKCTLSIKNPTGSVLEDYPSIEVSYTTTQAIGKITNLPPISKDAAYFYKIGLKVKEGKSSLRVMGKITDYTGGLANGVGVVLYSSDDTSVSTRTTNSVLTSKPFAVPSSINYKIDKPAYSTNEELFINIAATGITPKTINIKKDIANGGLNLFFDSVNGYYLIVDSSVVNNTSIANISFTGSVANQYKISYSDTELEDSPMTINNRIAGATVKYSVNNPALNYSVSGQVASDSNGNFSINDIPVSIITADSDKMVEINISINKEGYEEFIYNEKYINKNKQIIKVFIIEPSKTEKYDICIKVADKNNKPLNYSRVMVVPGDIEKLTTYSDYIKNHGMPIHTDTESLVQNGNWTMSLENFRDVLIHSNSNLIIDPSIKFSLFIIPWNLTDDKYFPVNRLLLVDGLELLRMTGGILDTYHSASCKNITVNFDSPVEPTNDYIIDLFDAETGDPINAKDENAIISVGNIFSDNSTSRMASSDYLQEYSSIVANRLILKIKSTRDIPESKLLYYSGKQYKLIDSGLDIENEEFPLKLYLLNSDRADIGMPCIEFNGFKFCGLKVPTMDILSEQQKINITKITKILSALKTIASDNRDIPIYIQSKSFWRARAYGNSIEIRHNAFSNPTAYFSLAYTSLDNYPYLLETAVHEYAHTIDFMSDLSDNNRFKFSQITVSGNTEAARVIMKKNNCCDSGQFPNFYYSANTNSRELWAEFFTWWYLHNDEFRKAIGNDSKLSAPCKEVLRFMYAVLQQTFPNVTPYDQVTTTSSADAADKQVSILPQLATLAAAGSSTSELDAIMLEAGFKKTTGLIKTESVTPLTGTIFTEDQILNGTWIKKNYDKASFSDKVAIQYQTMMSTIKASSVAQNLSSIASTAVNKFNQAYDALLKQFGRYKSTGNVKGRITDKKGIGIANMLVSFGGKYATTDKNGDYSISNLQPGASQIYSVKDLYTQEEYSLINSQRITVVASRTAKADVTIDFPTVKLTGTLSAKDGKAKANIKLTFIGANKQKLETTTDKDGKYSLDGFYYQQYTVTAYSGKTAQSLDSNSKKVTPKKVIAGENAMSFNIKLSK